MAAELEWTLKEPQAVPVYEYGFDYDCVCDIA